MAKFVFVKWLINFFNTVDYFDFDWDAGNLTKNEIKHGVTCDEVESAFYSDLILPIGKQTKPRVSEDRYAFLGSTTEDRVLFICFTIRGDKIRPISVRDATDREMKTYGY